MPEGLGRTPSEGFKKARWCDCIIPASQGYCHVHDATLTCTVEGCDLPFPHQPDGVEHVSPCGCWYWNAGQFDFCAEHEAEQAAELPPSAASHIVALREALALRPVGQHEGE